MSVQIRWDGTTLSLYEDGHELPAVPKLRASDLLTHCDHCGSTLVGEYDDRKNRTVLRCSTTNAVRQVIPAADTAEWPERALEQLYRMCKNR